MNSIFTHVLYLTARIVTNLELGLSIFVMNRALNPIILSNNDILHWYGSVPALIAQLFAAKSEKHPFAGNGIPNEILLSITRFPANSS